MSKFINANSGLKSRFNKHHNFERYKPSKLLSIFQIICNQNHFELEPEAQIAPVLSRTLKTALCKALAPMINFRTYLGTMPTNVAQVVFYPIPQNQKRIEANARLVTDYCIKQPDKPKRTLACAPAENFLNHQVHVKFCSWLQKF